MSPRQLAYQELALDLLEKESNISSWGAYRPSTRRGLNSRFRSLRHAAMVFNQLRKQGLIHSPTVSRRVFERGDGRIVMWQHQP